jgi:hypothetical protein
VERFDVLLCDATSGATITREWSKAEMLRSVAWLKRMNGRGNNIFVRPSGEHNLALLDRKWPKCKDIRLNCSVAWIPKGHPPSGKNFTTAARGTTDDRRPARP